MKHYNLKHNSPEWFMARAGVATTSCFDQIITPTGKPSAQADAYANLLIAERLLQGPVQRNFSVYSLEWGQAYEQEAIELYRFDTGHDVEPGGFYTNDAGTLGASPDLRIVKDGAVIGLAEIKCPENPAKHVEFMLMDEMNPKYRPQVQGQMYISGLDWVDWFSYYDGMPAARIRIERDAEYIAKLADALAEFERLLVGKMDRLVELGYIDTRPEKEISEGKAQAADADWDEQNIFAG